MRRCMPLRSKDITKHILGSDTDHGLHARQIFDSSAAKRNFYPDVESNSPTHFRFQQAEKKTLRHGGGNQPTCRILRPPLSLVCRLPQTL